MHPSSREILMLIRRGSRLRLVTAAFLALILAGCATESVRHNIKPFPDPSALPTSEGLCPFGIPEMGSSWDDLELTVILRDGYWLLHDDELKTPVWVCEELVYEDVHGPLTGRDSWCADPHFCGPEICNPAECERGAVNSDYAGSGFDRGHLAPNMNQRRDAERKRETFYFSNAAPQVGQGFNQSVWAFFETEMSVHMCVPDRFWTITGLLYPETARGRTAETLLRANPLCKT